MSIANTLFEFTDALIKAAATNDALKDVELRANVYGQIGKGKTIKIDDLRSAKPVITADRKIRRDNAIINLVFAVMPGTDSIEDKLIARETAERMTDEWLIAMHDDSSLGQKVCNVGEVAQFNDWVSVGTRETPVCILQLKINPR